MNDAVFAVLAKVFLCTSPFALFCSKNGNGIQLCIVFLILGGICWWIGDGGLNPTIRVKPKDWWETQFRDSIAKKRDRELTNHEVQESLKWADYITSSNKLPMPTDEEKERIMESMGIESPKVKKEKRDHIDRIQFGKKYLLDKAIKEYDARVLLCDNYREASALIKRMKRGSNMIRDTKAKVTLIGMTGLNNQFGTWDIDKIWNDILSDEERTEAEKWVNETIERFKQEELDIKNISVPEGYYVDYEKKYGFDVYRRDLL